METTKYRRETISHGCNCDGEYDGKPCRGCHCRCSSKWTQELFFGPGIPENGITDALEAINIAYEYGKNEFKIEEL